MSAGGFVKVPTRLLYDPEVPDGALRTYLALARYAISCSSDTFELTADALGTLLGRSRRHAIRRIEELQQLGLVVVEGNRGRGRPNLLTVLDPQDEVFAGLHVARKQPNLAQPAMPTLAQPARSDLAQPYRQEVEDESGQRTKRSARALGTSPPVDDGGASRPPIPRRERCQIHEPPGSWSDATECRGCVADAKAAGWSRRPAF